MKKNTHPTRKPSRNTRNQSKKKAALEGYEDSVHINTEHQTVREHSKQPTNREPNEIEKLRNEIGKLITQGIADAIPTIAVEVKNIEEHSKRTRKFHFHTAHNTYKPYTKTKHDHDEGRKINDNINDSKDKTEVEKNKKNEADDNEQKRKVVFKCGKGECTYKDFKTCDQPDLFGNKDAMEALQWMREMEAVIDLSKCAEEDVVQFTAHSFKGESFKTGC
ncbi:hypothetical protein L1987_39875 [Smallanthus sonchifolius]|uniref:Uncharacterized protein n=1 Tax=Smallanthus sonchifolius TaxID=185202 RepID=A0ACB9GT81_9ASTR|nr:hypothetical protein L1987_39875 [Smallanthus sonchifolius]